jgi:F-type H+-transporting ATPase subunit a
MEHQVTIAAEKIAQIGPFVINNALLTTWLVMGLILIFAYFAGKNVRLLPSTLQNFAETIIEAHQEDGKEVLVPLFRSANSDINLTLSLALISVLVTHYFSITTLGFGSYLARYLSLNPIYLFVGILEIIAEFTKVISLSFRLFGNIFAGEALLVTISGILAFIAPLPFMMLELLVGFVQATVFMMLTLVFMTILTEKHEAH